MSSQYEDWNSKRFGRVITEDELSKRSDPMWLYKYFNPGTPVSKEKVNELVKEGEAPDTKQRAKKEAEVKAAFDEHGKSEK